MKGFKEFAATYKWSEKNLKSPVGIYEIGEDFWKAALLWALNHDDLIDHYQLDYIKEELQGD